MFNAFVIRMSQYSPGRNWELIKTSWFRFSLSGLMFLSNCNLTLLEITIASSYSSIIATIIPEVLKPPLMKDFFGFFLS